MKKKSIFKRWWFWVLAVIIVIMVFNSTGDEDQPQAVNQDDATATASDQTKQAEEPAGTKAEFSVGEAIKLGDNQLTVTKVEKSAGDDFDKPKEGNEYVVLTLQIENKGDSTISYNPYDFQMSNTDGQITDPALTIIDNDTSLSSGDLAAGGKVSGTIVFEQPKGDEKLQLIYSPSFWSDDQIIVNIK